VLGGDNEEGGGGETAASIIGEGAGGALVRSEGGGEIGPSIIRGGAGGTGGALVISPNGALLVLLPRRTIPSLSVSAFPRATIFVAKILFFPIGEGKDCDVCGVAPLGNVPQRPSNLCGERSG
jgi:hypothetical protein